METLLSWVPEGLRHPAILALIVAVASVALAKLVELLLCGVLLRLARRTRTEFDEKLIEALHRPIFVSVLLIGVWMAVLTLGPPEVVMSWTDSIVQTVAIFVWIGAGLRVVSLVSGSMGGAVLRREWIDERTLPLFDNLARLILLGAAAYFLLLAWNLNISAWLASAGIAGLALGLAAQDTLSNIFGGLSIIADAPYKVGDWVNLDGGDRGRVTKIGLRSTRMMTRDDVEITVPNAAIASGKIINESGGPSKKSRVSVLVGVAYGSDVDHVREVLLRAAQGVELVVDDPAPRIRFIEMADSALVFRVLCWIEFPELRGECVDGLNTAIYKALMVEGITIPFPQRDVHLHPDTTATPIRS
ncbi:MAG: mechanosensitive ion channel family protein [Vicinamibacterales bacterium]